MAEDAKGENLDLNPEEGGRSWKSRIVWLGSTILGLLVVWGLAVSLVPRWWAERLSDVVDGSITTGSMVGVGLGFIFTLLPLVVLRIGWRFRAGAKRAMVFVVLAVLLAAPNLMTLGIVVGTGSGAHAAERNLDVDAPGVRAGSLIGALIAAAAMIGVSYLAWSRKRNKTKAQELAAKAEE